MGMSDTFGAGSLGFSGLVLAVLERPGLLRALRRRAGQTAQDAHRLGGAAAALGEALVSRGRDRGCGRRGYAALKLLDRCRRLSQPITFITRLRLDAALYEPAPPRHSGQIGRPRLKGDRLPNLSVLAEDPTTDWAPITLNNWYGNSKRTIEIVSGTALWHSTVLPAVALRWVLIRDPQEELETQALLCTDLAAEPEQIISWFVRRWQMEATFQEVRQRLGFETQWSEAALRRTTPAPLGLFSVVTLLAQRHMAEGAQIVRKAAWYEKAHPTFSDALALVRRQLWAREETFYRSSRESDTVKVPREFMERLTEAICYAA